MTDEKPELLTEKPDILDELSEHRKRVANEREGTPSINCSTADMGDVAKQIRWKTGSKGALAVRLDNSMQIHIGSDSMDPQMLRQIGCAIIGTSYELERAAAARAKGGVPIIGG